jgi:hypothetical protein
MKRARDLGLTHSMLRLAAVPAAHVATDEVVVADLAATQYLFDRQAGTLTPLTTTDAAMVATFFDYVGDLPWEPSERLLDRLRLSAAHHDDCAPTGGAAA